MKHYADRGMDVLREPQYMAHVQAMTAEQLHSKADIAAELAFRDIQIKKARGMVAALCMTAKRKSYTDGFWQDVNEFLNPPQASDAGESK